MTLATCAVLLALAGGCAAPPLRPGTATSGLAGAIVALGPEVDAAEAQRAAAALVRRAGELELEYRRVGTPRLHNLLVNLGLRRRGLCCDFVEDLIAEIQLLGLTTLDVHWGVARYGEPFHEHSGVLLVARGGDWRRGLLVDAWRDAGGIFWSPVGGDPNYQWVRHPLSGDWERLRCQGRRLLLIR